MNKEELLKRYESGDRNFNNVDLAGLDLRGITFRQSNLSFKGAIADYTKSFDFKNPALHLPYNSRGIAKSDLGEYKEGAIADYTKAIRIKLDYADAYYGRGNAK